MTRDEHLSRRVATADDCGFAMRTHHLAYRDVVERQFGQWDVADQDAYFSRAWSQHEQEIIEWDGQRCGYTAIEFGRERVDVHELVLDPAYQHRGLGTAILTETIADARDRGLDVYLQVLRENRASHLYERIGFRVYDETASHRLMRFEQH